MSRVIQSDQLILDPADPIPSAIAFSTAHCSPADIRYCTLNRCFMKPGRLVRSGVYTPSREIPTDAVRGDLWRFLERATKLDQKGNAVRFAPRLRDVNQALAALKAVLSDRKSWGIAA